MRLYESNPFSPKLFGFHAVVIFKVLWFFWSQQLESVSETVSWVFDTCGLQELYG